MLLVQVPMTIRSYEPVPIHGIIHVVYSEFAPPQNLNEVDSWDITRPPDFGDDVNVAFRVYCAGRVKFW